MYDNPFDLCDCAIFNCDCGGGLKSYLPHYARVLAAVRPKRVFEWGPGENTRMALAAGAEVFAVEPLLKWVASLPTDHQGLAVLITPTDSPSYLSLHGRDDSDLFFVDSRRRAECLDLVRSQAKPDAVVCLHDAQRKRYNKALQRYNNVVFLAPWFAVASMRQLPSELRRPAQGSVPPISSEYSEEGHASQLVTDVPTQSVLIPTIGSSPKHACKDKVGPGHSVSNPNILVSQPSVTAESPKVLFSSYHCYLDPSSGAASSTRDMLELLAARGWFTRVLCGPQVDRQGGDSARKMVSDLGVTTDEKRFEQEGDSFSVVHYLQNKVPVSIYQPDHSGEPTGMQITQFLRVYERLLDTWRPDLLVTYGGQWVGKSLMHAARKRGIQVVFSLRNFAYRGAELFDQADAVLVPSRFAAKYYEQQLGLECTAIPSPIIWSRAECVRTEEQRFVTFVNPQLCKGAAVFARIAIELGSRRPDIPLLIVEGRNRSDQLRELEADLSGLSNLYRMANTPDPREFYRVTKLLLVPSLWNESFGRVAVEAMLNGIPLLCSDRGALPETVGRGGFTFSVPSNYTPDSRNLPSSAEVDSWVTTIERLWDDEAFYREASGRARAAADCFREDEVAGRYADFFRNIILAGRRQQ